MYSPCFTRSAGRTSEMMYALKASRYLSYSCWEKSWGGFCVHML